MGRAFPVLWEATQRTRELLPRARFIELPEHGQALFELTPLAVVDAIAEFIRG